MCTCGDPRSASGVVCFSSPFETQCLAITKGHQLPRLIGGKPPESCIHLPVPGPWKFTINFMLKSPVIFFIRRIDIFVI